jgi:hypothetical protein
LGLRCGRSHDAAVLRRRPATAPPASAGSMTMAHRPGRTPAASPFDGPATNSYAMAMRLVEDAVMVEWLRQLGGEPQDFDWDAGNRIKLRKHGVQAAEVEEMFRARTVFVGRIVEPMMRTVGCSSARGGQGVAWRWYSRAAGNSSGP